MRILQTGYRSAAQNMGLDEAVLNEIAEGRSPATLRLYGWNPPAISIGYFQSLEEEVDTAACRKRGVDIVRRITGGGAVLHEHEITYSIHIPETAAAEYGIPLGVLESYGKICGGILKGLALLGLDAKFVPLNDIIVVTPVGPKKISGNAQTRKRGIILQHGTVLLKVDVEKMFSLLKVPNEKLKGKLIEDVKQRVTSVSDALGRTVQFVEAAGVLKKGFSAEFFGIALEEGTLSAQEAILAEKFEKEKYGASDWIEKR